MAAKTYRRVEPAYREDGKYVCPECLSRQSLEIVNYNTKDKLFLFVIRCKKCYTEFQVLKDI